MRKKLRSRNTKPNKCINISWSLC